MRLFLQTLVGYGATGYAREQKFYIFKGVGANGKGTFIGLVLDALGKYAAKANTGMLAEQGPDRPRNDLAALAGARLVSMSENSAHFRLDEGNLKTITGEDVISARFLHKEFFQFRPVFTPILDTNHVPSFRETGTAMRRRLKIVPGTLLFPNARWTHACGNTFSMNCRAYLRGSSKARSATSNPGFANRSGSSRSPSLSWLPATR